MCIKTHLDTVYNSGDQSASHSNVEILYQNKVLKNLSNGPWFIGNTEVHGYINIPTIKESSLVSPREVH